MASIKFSRKEVEKQLGIKINEEIEEKISMMGTHVESINAEEIELDILPNRPDLFSLNGFIRAFSSFLGKKLGLKKYNVKKSGFKLIVDKSLPKQWPYAFACIVKGLKFDDEKIKNVINIQEKLGATFMRNRKKGGIGLYPLEKISFPVKFIGRKPEEIKFKPLEYPQIINGRQILSKHPTGREYANICQDWDKFPIFIDKNNNIMSMPPIINSHDMGKITEETKEVFLECTGTNAKILKKAINLIVTALADMGGEIYSVECQQQEGKKEDIPNLSPEKMKLSLENTNKLLGLELNKEQIKKLLEKMGYDYDKNKSEVLIPPYRTDIMHEVDIIEDIAIAYGYDNITAEIPQISTTGEISRVETIKKKIAEILCGLNMLEISSYHLLTKEEAKLMGIKEQIIEVEKSKTDYSILRPDLISSSLKILSQNKDVEYPQRIFEIGTTFELDKENKTETGIKEPEKLCIALANNTSNFTEIKQVWDYLARMLGKEYTLDIPQKESLTTQFLIEGRCAEIKVNNKVIGHLGEIKPQILGNIRIKVPIAALELDIEELC